MSRVSKLLENYDDIKAEEDKNKILEIKIGDKEGLQTVYIDINKKMPPALVEALGNKLRIALEEEGFTIKELGVWSDFIKVTFEDKLIKEALDQSAVLILNTIKRNVTEEDFKEQDNE